MEDTTITIAAQGAPRGTAGAGRGWATIAAQGAPHDIAGARRRLGPIIAALATALLAALALGAAACRSAGAAKQSSVAQCAGDRPGTLRVRNFTGRLLEIHVRRATSPPQFLRNISPGVTELPVPGPADQTVRYDVIDPAAGRRLGAVTWLRPTSSGGATGVVVELGCA